MTTEMSSNRIESDFLVGLEKRPIPTTELLKLIDSLPAADCHKCHELTLLLLEELIEVTDFIGTFITINTRLSQLQPLLQGAEIAALLKKSAKERLHIAQLESVDLARTPLPQALPRLERLLRLKPGLLVMDATWGVGTVKRLDDFYKRVTLDFTGKPNHTMSFQAAADSLDLAPPTHLLTRLHQNPTAIMCLVDESPDQLVKETLASFGNMSAGKLENTLTHFKIVAPTAWKSFWDSARKLLRGDPLVVLPTKRGDEVILRTEVESYGIPFFAKLATTKLPEQILEAVAQLDSADKLTNLAPDHQAILHERVAAALTGAHNTNAALYARLAVAAKRIGLASPTPTQMCAHLWEEQRYLSAATELGVRDTANMAALLLSEGESATTRLLADLPLMSYNILNEVLALLRDNTAAAQACQQLLAQPKPPATLINWYFRARATTSWPLPPLIQMLSQAVATAEESLSGEALRMQNSLKQMFLQAKWLSAIFTELDGAQRQLLFDRIQVSQAWETINQRTLIGRMIKLDPTLAKRKRAAATQSAQPEPRLTSWRSLRAHEEQYKRLVEVELVQNTKDIAEARSYGDLRENFEYQAAKELQRQLLQRQTTMQRELKEVRGTDFPDGTCDSVAPGTTVTLRLADGSRHHYSILGEWDSDVALGIISNKTALAAALLGKSVGDSATIPTLAAPEAVTIEAITPLVPAVRVWLDTTALLPPT